LGEVLEKGGLAVAGVAEQDDQIDLALLDLAQQGAVQARLDV
jgi:hypothetical protein